MIEIVLALTLAAARIGPSLPGPDQIDAGECRVIEVGPKIDTAIIDVTPVDAPATSFAIECVDDAQGQRFCVPAGLPAGSYLFEARLYPAADGPVIALAPRVYVVTSPLR